MSIPKEHAQEFARFPAVLRELVTTELAAGNAIAEFGHGFPAAPCGAYIKLARPVSSRPRQQSPELDFFERNNCSYSGEFTDAKRHFFVLEPPRLPEPEPDMNAIREKLQATYATANPLPLSPVRAPCSTTPKPRAAAAAKCANPNPRPQAANSLLARFQASMVMNYEKWHEGIGYDLELLKSASPEELVEIENLLVNRRIEDWRDVEALAALNTPRARVLLRQARESSDPSIATAVVRYAPGLISNAERAAVLVKALESAAAFGGLSQTLAEVEQFHPPEVVEALLRGVQARDGETAVHFAAMLMFIHGQARSAFDWELRPFFLRFNTGDAGERSAAYRELCDKLGIRATPPSERPPP